MIKIQVNDEMFAYDMYHISKAFCPGVEIEQKVDRESAQAVSITMIDCAGRPIQFAISADELSGVEERKSRKRYVNLKVYNWLSEAMGKELAWGIMTGVRPTKPMMNLIESGMTDEEGQPMESCPHPKQKIYVDLGIELSPFDLLRRKDD